DHDDEPSLGLHDIDRRLPRWPLRAIGAEPKKMPLQAIGALEQVKCLLPHPNTLVTALHGLSPEAIAGRRRRKRGDQIAPQGRSQGAIYSPLGQRSGAAASVGSKTSDNQRVRWGRWRKVQSYPGVAVAGPR